MVSQPDDVTSPAGSDPAGSDPAGSDPAGSDPSASGDRVRLTPISLADRLGVSVATVVIGLAAIAAALAGGWWALRPPATPDADAVLPVASETPAGPDPAGPQAGVADASSSHPESGSPGSKSIFVHVAGAVVAPGVHELESGSRVIDAVGAAGGLSESADPARLNLAEPLADGSRLWVPSRTEPTPPLLVHATPANTAAGSTAAGISDRGAGGPGLPANQAAHVDINQADEVLLQQLPGIGPALAAAIVAHRDEVGAFVAVDDLESVSGIGSAKLELLRPFAHV